RDVFRLRHDEVGVAAAADLLAGELALLVDAGVRLRDVVAFFLERREELDVLGDLALVDLAVGRLDEAELVHARVGRQRRDEADVRTFRRLDRADTTVVRSVDVAHLEAGALTRETTRPEGREAALVRHF